MITAQAPAKIILSGEHAVLHNNSALAIAINLYTTTTVSFQDKLAINFSLKNLAYIKSLSFDALKKTLSAKAITKPFKLVQYLVANLISNLNVPLKHGLNITVTSEIPVGYGLGSSAACIISNLAALNQALNLNLPESTKLAIAQQVESLQHGRSSGLDLKISNYGGCLRISPDQTQNRKISNFPLYLINTGKPLANTRACVLHTSRILENNYDLLSKFSAVTEQIDLAISTNNYTDFKEGVKNNHRLLQQISVVPDKVASFISQIEKQNGAGKICGAGSIQGDCAGFVLVTGEQLNLPQLAANYGYNIQEVQIDERGTRVL